MKSTSFADRHIGISDSDIQVMLQKIGVSSLEELISKTIPADIRLDHHLPLKEAMSEDEFGRHISSMAEKNKLFKSYIGQGWYSTITPAVIQRNVLENPVWYTSYTPYQAEVSQGRLEALINFQTVISDLTGMPLSNCSLLDEATAAAETATMMFGLRSRAQQKANVCTLFVDEEIFPQNLAVIQTRAIPQGIHIVTGKYSELNFTPDIFGCIIQYPNNSGNIEDYRAFTRRAHKAGCKVAVDADILALTLLVPPGEWDADIVFGSTQRLGIPMYYGGPSAAYCAVKDEYKRNIPGRIIGISKDKYGHECYRLALQTREQHIKREKATSNICTAQALMATMAGLYAVYHGPEGITDIAHRIHRMALWLNSQLTAAGYIEKNQLFFDTLRLTLPTGIQLHAISHKAIDNQINLRYFDNGDIGISINESTTIADLNRLLAVLVSSSVRLTESALTDTVLTEYGELARTSSFLTHEVFNSYHTEMEMMRYIKRLERKDISLTHSMISLGSCTMKLTAASEMLPLSNPKWMDIHPLAPSDQAEGYLELIHRVEEQLKTITGFEGITLQPNSGAAGEYTGLRIIRSYHESREDHQRNIVLIPSSAHGTNPASAVQAGFTPVIVGCDEKGNVDLNDLRHKAEENQDKLAALMITYPSTHGIFESAIKEICHIIHQCGGQVYMDGANMNAQVGLTHPGFIGADVCHLNLHKTFAMPHGGGGPGVGAVGVAPHLVAFLPGHVSTRSSANQVSSAPYGSAGLLPITYGYISMMGPEGLERATKAAILNANYLAACLKDSYGIVYTGENGFVGHEMILECRTIHEESGITENDISKRLMDYGYHAPTLSFPVHGTLMIEPTESESLAELNNFVDTMMSIFHEIEEIKQGKASQEDNVIINAPHPEYEIVSDEWSHTYGREKAAYPIATVRNNKFWINVARIDNTLGDRKLLPTRYGHFE